jgi:hypothetical protein
MNDEPASTPGPLPLPKRRGRKPNLPLQEDALWGGGYVQSLQRHLSRLRDAQHGNRRLHFDALVTALLLAFYNPTCRSLRTLEGLSQFARVRRQTGIDKICRSTTSDALACFNPALLLPLIRELRQRVCHLPRVDDQLANILRQVIAADGSYFNIYADVAWAIHLTRSNGKPGAQIRLNFQLDVRNWTPEHLSLSGREEGSEIEAVADELRPGVIYVCDRNFAAFAFLQAVLDQGSDFVVRCKDESPHVTVREERPLTEQDRQHGVVHDRQVVLPGRNAPQRTLREVILQDPRTDRTIRVLTSLEELPAHIIGVLYRHRWQIELFFRWLKVWGNFKHLISHSRNGLTIQFYVAVIGVLLMYVRTGRRVSKYAFSLLTVVAAGAGTLEEIAPILAQREREKELERQRLARKRAQKTGN